MANEPGTKERVIYVLKTLLELVENDRVRASEIANLTTAEIIERAEAEAAKAVTESEKLKNID
jgi:hypothetical protein